MKTNGYRRRIDRNRINFSSFVQGKELVTLSLENRILVMTPEFLGLFLWEIENSKPKGIKVYPHKKSVSVGRASYFIRSCTNFLNRRIYLTSRAMKSSKIKNGDWVTVFDKGNYLEIRA